MTNNYPLAMLPVVNKPVLCYQLEYLLKHGIRNIMISVEKKLCSKIEKYLKHHWMSPDPMAEIELVVLAEDSQPAPILRVLEKRIKNDLIVIEGNSLVEVPLDEMIDTHCLGKSTITCMFKEQDMLKKQQAETIETNEVYGISDHKQESEKFETPMRDLGQQSSVRTPRLVFRATKIDCKEGSVEIKASLLKKAN